ncbi:hypothetical protein [Lysinibacillus boronitolerans]|uniref:hypothetical protein n=1 Tax=Lysinibacillus boronitolerans TaxID=309788 RepID=UPI003854B879
MEVKGRDGNKKIYGSKETPAQTIARLEAEKQALEAATFDMAVVLDAQAQHQITLENAIFDLANMIAGGI